MKWYLSSVEFVSRKGIYKRNKMDTRLYLRVGKQSDKIRAYKSLKIQPEKQSRKMIDSQRNKW